MKDNLASAARRMTVFAALCLSGLAALVVVFGQFRFNSTATYYADFSNVSGLEQGNFVRIAGVEVGKVGQISIGRDARVRVQFRLDSSVMLAAGAQAIIRYDNLIGGRYIALLQGRPGSSRLQPGQTIPLADTAPALDLDALIGGFRPLFRAISPDQLNALSSQLISAFQGEGDAINRVLAQTGQLTATFADRDQLIQQVITNLNTVVGSIAGQVTQFDKAVDATGQIISTLTERKTAISDAVAYGNASAAQVAELLRQSRAPFKDVVTQSDRVSSLVAADSAYVDDLLNTLPDTYKALARQGIYGDFFSFYMCDAVLKLNGKGGQPVYVKLASQPTGRCAPK
ncbi:MCE family protein [Mycolicibacter algericus]|nr:MCE family protein [Mycolicibacter algericus]